MIVIFGTRNRHTTLSAGQFFCPHCTAKRDYELRRIKTYFAL